MLKVMRGYDHFNTAGIFRALSLFIFLVAGPLLCHAQKYAFTHYDIEDGLLQSQVNGLTLDREHRLWIATYGGVCRFDGKEFVSFTRQNGLPTNFVNVVFTDKNDNEWFGTQNGLVRMVNKKLVPLKFPEDIDNRHVRSIVQDGDGNVLALIGGRLFKAEGDTLKQLWVQDTIKRLLTSLDVDKSGKLYVSVYGKGLYKMDRGKWTNVVPYPANDRSFYVAGVLFDKADNNRIYIQTYTSIYTVENGHLQPFESKATASIKSYLLCLMQDSESNLWIGTTSGAYRLKNHQLTEFMANNGLTDNAVTDIYNDADNNLWFASQGNGLYKYEGNRFVILDRSQGMPYNEVIMGIVKDQKGDILLGSDGGGLMSYDGKKLSQIHLPSKDDGLKRIQCIYQDTRGTLWIGTHEGLWSYANGKINKLKDLENYAINGVTEGSDGVLWITTQAGCFYIDSSGLKHVANFYRFSSAVLALGKDSVIVGTNNGIALIVNKEVVKGYKLNAVWSSAVFCILKYQNKLIFGTDDRGIFTWNRVTGQVRNYSLKDGLNSNTIYSLITDDKGVIWVGTGRGVNQLVLNTQKDAFTVTSSQAPKSLILESNQNAAFYADHKVWVGTTKGAVIYDVNSRQAGITPPHVIIQSARLVTLEGPANGWMNSVMLNSGVTLRHNQNHLAIWFRGVDLKDPDGITYRYKLKGLDSAYSAPVKNDVVDFPSLPPGKYTFEVTAFSAGGVRSANTASFSFIITPAFYQAVWFRLAAVAALILLGFIIQNYRHRIKVSRQRVIEATKREESLKIRQQTAEDFHDELGNKLTRITVLSEILDTKMDHSQCDQKKLLEQIKQNAASLYNGTKDILWALDPKSDNLYEILNHIKDFGIDLFLDTPVRFEFNGIEESFNEVKLPMEYSRNLPMIFKELLNNTLKHAHATHVTIDVGSVADDEIFLTLKDNGCGFILNGMPKGQGINNIKMRTKRIGGEIDIASEKEKGTLIELRIRINNTVTN